MPTSRPRSLRRDAMMMLGSGVIVRLCGILFLMMLSRRLSEAQIGLFSFAEALADTFCIVASFSLDIVVVRRISAAPPEQAPDVFAPLLGFRLVSGPVYLLSMTIAAFFVHGAPWWLLPLVGLYTLVESLSFSFGGVLVGLGKIPHRAAIEAVTEIAYTALFLLAIFRFPSIVTLIILGSLRSTILLAWSSILVWRTIGTLRLRWEPRILREASPFLLMNFLGILQGRTEVVLLGVLASYSAVGIYQLAMRLVTASMFVPQSIGAVIFPRLAAEGLSGGNRRVLMQGLLAIAGMGLAGTACLLLFPGLIAQLLFGKVGISIVPVLWPLAMVLPIRFLSLGLSVALNALGREKRVLIALVICAVTGLFADLLLIPRFGATGAATASLIAAASQLLLLTIEMATQLKKSRLAKSAPPSSATLPRSLAMTAS